jgi:hypothetical protein
MRTASAPRARRWRQKIIDDKVASLQEQKADVEDRTTSVKSKGTLRPAI